MKRLIRNYRGRKARAAQRAAESRAMGPVAHSPKVGLRGAENPTYGLLMDAYARADALEAENRRLETTNMDQRLVIRDLRAEVRALKVEKHNEFLNWLCEPENYLLMQEHEPDLMRRLHEALDSGIPKPSTQSRDEGARCPNGHSLTPGPRGEFWCRVCP